ncbi:MAG: hypothetical protein ACKVQW_02610 [Pyrinomonadaceae bacterium]
MEWRISVLSVIFAAVVLSAACSRVNVGDATTASVSANPQPAPRMFDRRMLDVAGFHNLNEFIRPEVRDRLDKEPVGDGDEYVEQPSVSDSSSNDEPSGETVNTEDETDLDTRARDLEKVKFSWARRKFGDALIADPTVTGAIVLYADDTFYDIYRMLHLIDQGRDRLAADGGFDASRIQVIFGGYRGKAQVELWIIPEGQTLPEAKPEDREASAGPDSN